MKTLVDLPTLCAKLGIEEADVWPMVWGRRLPMPRGHAGTYRWKWNEVEARFPKEAKGFIYFAQCGEYVKIGFTYSLSTRLACLQTSNPHTIALLGYICGSKDDETTIHERFSSLRHRGEWFRDGPELRTFITGTAAERLNFVPAEMGTQAIEIQQPMVPP